MPSSHDIGLKAGILDRKHISAMGMSVWLYIWCVRHQTKSTGWVFGGSLITYKQIQGEIGVPERTLQRWMANLQRNGYVAVTQSWYSKMRILVMKSKKFNYRQGAIQFPVEEVKNTKYATNGGLPSATNGGLHPPQMADSNKRSKERYIQPLKKEAPSGADLVPTATWLEWVDYRRRIRKPLTDHARDLQLRDLAEWKAQGLDVVEIIEKSIKNGWTGLFVPKRGNGNGTGKESATELAIRNAKALGLTH